MQPVVAPTSKWFKVLCSIGIALASVGGIIIASPVALPVAVVSAAGYLVLGGSIISVILQTAVKIGRDTINKRIKNKSNYFKSSVFRSFFCLGQSYNCDCFALLRFFLSGAIILQLCISLPFNEVQTILLESK